MWFNLHSLSDFWLPRKCVDFFFFFFSGTQLFMEVADASLWKQCDFNEDTLWMPGGLRAVNLAFRFGSRQLGHGGFTRAGGIRVGPWERRIVRQRKEGVKARGKVIYGRGPSLGKGTERRQCWAHGVARVDMGKWSYELALISWGSVCKCWISMLLKWNLRRFKILQSDFELKH